MIAEEGLQRRAIRGGFWIFALRITEQILALVRLVILARLLSPNDFALMGIALITIATIDTLTQTGFDVALIQRKEQTETYLDSAWTVGILRGLALFGLLQLLAPYAAGFFKSPEAEVLIRAIGIALLLRCFINIGTVYFQKDLRFDKQFMYQFSGRFADFVVAVIAVLVLRNVWALVLAFLAGDAARLLVSYAIHPYRPRLSLSITKARELFKFGKWIMGSSTVLFFLNEGDKAFVGRVIGATMLGFYQVAHRISNLPATEFANVIALVTVPAYSKLQDRMAKLREAYLRVLQLTAFFSIPLAGLVLVLAPDLTRIFLGEKWMPAAPVMQALAIWGSARAIISTTGSVFVAVGKPRLMTKYQFIQLCVLVVLIYPMSQRWGMVGTASAVVVAGLGTSILFMRSVRTITGCRMSELVKLISFPLGTTVLAATSVLILIRLETAAGWPVIELGLAVGLYLAVYLVTTCILGGPFNYRVGSLIREVIGGIRTPRQ
ncbi:MAG: lipopolysaccharide biosynthesis protein [Candidatus Eisenbacteria bacterium]